MLIEQSWHRVSAGSRNSYSCYYSYQYCLEEGVVTWDCYCEEGRALPQRNKGRLGHTRTSALQLPSLPAAHFRPPARGQTRPFKEEFIQDRMFFSSWWPSLKGPPHALKWPTCSSCSFLTYPLDQEKERKAQEHWKTVKRFVKDFSKEIRRTHSSPRSWSKHLHTHSKQANWWVSKENVVQESSMNGSKTHLLLSP